MTFRPSVAIALGVLSLGSGAAAQRVELDVPYAAASHAEQHLDLHWPAQRPNAAVLFVHGGSLAASGERRSSPRYAKVCAPFVEAGIVCATTDYRLSPSFRWPVMALDVAAAAEEVRERLRGEGVDPSRLLLFGHSSGCHSSAPGREPGVPRERRSFPVGPGRHRRHGVHAGPGGRRAAGARCGRPARCLRA